VERFENHLLLHDNDDDTGMNTFTGIVDYTGVIPKCQKVIQYYLNNGYDLVDKYDKKVELILRQGPSTN
jgi:hypothetical protein